MSRNLGRQAHRAVQGAMHHKLDDDIADTRSLLNTSVQATKDLKAHLKGLTDKKKEAAGGKTQRNSHAGANTFNIPIPKIQGRDAAATRMVSSSESTPVVTTGTTVDLPVDSNLNKNSDSNLDIDMQEISPVYLNTPSRDHGDTATASTAIETTSESAPDVEMEEIAYLQGSSTTVETNSTPTSYLSHWHPGFDLPPFDLELFNATFEMEPIPELSDAEVAAHLFLRRSLQN